MEAVKSEVPQQEAPQAQPAVRFLSQEERNDLRKFVLSGGKLTVEQARAVYETLRSGSGAAVITGESTKKSRKKKQAYTDDALNADLAGLGL